MHVRHHVVNGNLKAVMETTLVVLTAPSFYNAYVWEMKKGVRGFGVNGKLSSI